MLPTSSYVTFITPEVQKPAFVLACESLEFFVGILAHLPAALGLPLGPFFFGSNRRFS